ncbi:MAG: flagellar biosynthesis protein FlhF [Sulfurihydrogenibium sp.]|uniref:flagellar biosynthesis protein FlhF n=1 Tax=Sulfurihydrogenibium sp. TaxID=2053621 RepID=UPI003D1139F4
MKIKIYEGFNLEDIINKIEQELGHNYKILYQDKIKVKTKIPFVKKTKHVLIVESTNSSEVKFEDILEEEIKKEEDSALKQNETPFRNYPLIEPEESPKKIEINLDQKVDYEFEEVTKEFSGKAIDLIKMLTEKEVSLNVAKEIVKKGCGLELTSNKLDLKHFTIRESLIEGLKNTLNFKGDIFENINKRKVIAFLGPTGVGKTTNLFKIASNLVLNKKMKVAVLSIDTFKAGAGDQARSYSNILGIPFYLLSDPKKIRETVDDLNFVDVILIDTIGRSHYDHWKLGEIKETLRFLDEIEYMMVVSCNMNTKESVNILEKYQKFFMINYLFFTKIDETIYPGIILNLAYKTGIPLTYISTGQNVPEDLKVLTAERLASYLLRETE